MFRQIDIYMRPAAPLRSRSPSSSAPRSGWPRLFFIAAARSRRRAASPAALSSPCSSAAQVHPKEATTPCEPVPSYCCDAMLCYVHATTAAVLFVACDRQHARLPRRHRATPPKHGAHWPLLMLTMAPQALHALTHSHRHTSFCRYDRTPGPKRHVAPQQQQQQQRQQQQQHLPQHALVDVAEAVVLKARHPRHLQRRLPVAPQKAAAAVRSRTKTKPE